MVYSWHWSRDWLNVPNFVAVLSNGAIAAKLSRLGKTSDGHFCPFIVVTIGVIYFDLGLDIRVEIKAGDILISTITQLINDWMNNFDITEEAALDGIKDFPKPTSNIASLAIGELLPNPIDSFNSLTKYEHVLLADLLRNLNIGAIHCSNDEAAIHHKFHVGGTRSFCARSRNVLRELRGWDDHLSRGDVVVGQEDHLEKVAYLRVIVYLLLNRSDQLDDGLGGVVGWGCLSTNHHYSRDEFRLSLRSRCF